MENKTGKGPWKSKLLKALYPLRQEHTWVSYGGNGHDPYRSILLVKPISQPIVRKRFSIPHGLKAMVKVPQVP